MALKKKKYYVVWEGNKPGVYTNWNECLAQLKGFSSPVFKTFYRYDVAEKAFKEGPEKYINENYIEPPLFGFAADKSPLRKTKAPLKEALAVDAACSGNPGPMEYRGVEVSTGKEIFRAGPFPLGTNNIGEFLAIVHGLALLKKQNSALPLYSDSEIAISWVKQRTVKTKLPRNEETESLFQLIDRALTWLRNNTWENEILKWDTAAWGEIPADFGRK